MRERRIALQDVINEMSANPGNGDIASAPYEIGFMVDKERKIIMEGDPDRAYPFSADDFRGNKWTIVKAEPKVLTAEGVYSQEYQKRTIETTEDWEILLVKSGMKQGQLKEWNRTKWFRDIIKEVLEHQPNYPIDRIFKAIEKLNPPE